MSFAVMSDLKASYCGWMRGFPFSMPYSWDFSLAKAAILPSSGLSAAVSILTSR